MKDGTSSLIDERPAGVVASDPVVDEEKELDLDDLETMVSVEVEEEFQDADEGQAEAFIDDDDDDLAVVGSFELVQDEAEPSARGDPVPMDVDDESTAGQSSSKSASAGAAPPTSKSKPKKKAMPKPEKKAMPKMQKTGEVHGPRHNPKKEQFDTTVFTSAQDLAWLEPENMAGIPGRNVEGGRHAISHAMSDYLRGHRLFHRRPSPDIRRSDLSMDFQSLIRHLQGDFPHLKEQEVLMVVKNFL